MIVDFEQRTVINLLPDRDVTGVAAWLPAHPSIPMCRYGIALHGIVARHHAAAQVADRVI